RGQGRHLQFRHQARRLPRRARQDFVDAGRDRLGDHLEISELHPRRRRFGRRVLLGGDHQQLAAGRHRHQDDPSRPQYALDDHFQGHLGRERSEHLPRPGPHPAEGGERAQLHAVRQPVDRRPVRRAHRALYRSAQSDCTGRTRSDDVEDQRRTDVLLPAARPVERGRAVADHQRLLQGSAERAADGIRSRGTETAGGQSRRQRGLKMLEIKNLHARISEGREILKGVDLTVKPGEIHAIMGPNGSGKSTLAGVLSGKPGYEVTEGQVLFQGRDLLAMAADERARDGVFLAFQYPVEIPGVNNMYFLRAALNAVRKRRGESEMDAGQFLKAVRAKLKLLELGEDLLQRGVNVGFSGGEKKRNEIFQMAMLEPKLAILDETDSGLDIDALQMVSRGINALRAPERAIVMITHYQRLLEHVVPDRVHVLSGGRIVKSGGKELALELEQTGYGAYGDAA